MHEYLKILENEKLAKRKSLFIMCSIYLVFKSSILELNVKTFSELLRSSEIFLSSLNSSSIQLFEYIEISVKFTNLSLSLIKIHLKRFISQRKIPHEFGLEFLYNHF